MDIRLLSEETIDKIAAGEVVDRPAGVVKELLENAIDSGAGVITLEVKEGGISFIRVTDNGSGIRAEQVPTAFLRHATSKIRNVEDLLAVQSLGFRGEALSSIGAVALVEMMTHHRDEDMGTHYVFEGAKEIKNEAIGVPVGTTLVVKNLFFNTPARRKFLKSANTEGSYINSVAEHIALSHPEVSIKYVNGGSVKFHTSGRGDLKEVIYHIYGREVSSQLLQINSDYKGISLKGFVGKSSLVRSTRNYETFFVNGRYVKSSTLSKALEEGCDDYLMQHKFPFAVLNLSVPGDRIDVNVHPTKQEVRFSNEQEIYDFITGALKAAFKVNEMIPEVKLTKEIKPETVINPAPEPFEANRINKTLAENNPPVSRVSGQNIKDHEYREDNSVNNISFKEQQVNYVCEKLIGGIDPKSVKENNIIKARDAIIVNNSVQMELFDDKLLSKESINEYNILGQIFKTYWLIEYRDKLLILDQHAAHEKVKYEALLQKMKENHVDSQMVLPPIAINLSSEEYEIYLNNKISFEKIGFEIEDFGNDDIALRGIPLDLYGCNPKELFLDILNDIKEYRIKENQGILDKIAGMACKSAVKGGMEMKAAEVQALLKDMLALDNPYNCPHGRPTLITITKNEMERRFKRIV